MIIDGNNLILGRLASVAAKKILLGEKVDIVNCDNVVITGTKENILARFKQRFHRTGPQKGPFFNKNPEGLVKKTVRGMIPFAQSRGREAFKNLKCYVGIPEKFKREKLETIKSADVEKRNTKYMKLKRISELIK